MFSIIYNYPSWKPQFFSRYHLSCLITDDIMMLSPAKISHLPHGTPPITPAYRLTFTEALLFVVISYTEMVSYFLHSGGLHLILSQITISVFLSIYFFFPFSFRCSISLSLSVCLNPTLSTFHFIIFFLCGNLRRLKGFLLIAAAAAAAYIVQRQRCFDSCLPGCG